MTEQTKEAKQKALLAQLQCNISKGEIVFNEDENSRELYILLSGVLEIRRGDQVLAVIKEKNTYLGEMSTLLGLPRTATVVATENCKLVKIPEEKVIDFFNHSPQLALKLSTIIATRLNEMNNKQKKLMETMGTPDYESTALYERLVCTPARKKLMATYKENIGSSINNQKLEQKLQVSPSEYGRIITDFKTSKLLIYKDEAIEFLPLPNSSLKQHIAAFTLNSNS